MGLIQVNVYINGILTIKLRSGELHVTTYEKLRIVEVH